MRESVKPLLRAYCDALVAYAVHTLYPPHPEERPKAASRRMGGHSRAAVRAGQGGLARTAASYMRNVGASPAVRRIHVFLTEHGCVVGSGHDEDWAASRRDPTE